MLLVPRALGHALAIPRLAVLHLTAIDQGSTPLGARLRRVRIDNRHASGIELAEVAAAGPMDLSERKVGNAVLASVSGRLDLANADEFKDKLSAAQAKTKTALVLDMSGVEYISSAGLRALMIVFKQGKTDGKSFAVAALAPLVKEIFTISRFNLVFPLFDSVRAALQSQAPDALSAFDAG